MTLLQLLRDSVTPIPAGSIAPAAILVAAIVAWLTQRSIARRKATLDFISQHEIGNEGWEKATRTFAKYSSRKDHASALIALVNTEDGDPKYEHRLQIAAVLNHFEAVAVAIEHGAISEKMYKAWNRSNYIEAWHKAQSYITERRKSANRETTYLHFQGLAEKWQGGHHFTLTKR